MKTTVTYRNGNEEWTPVIFQTEAEANAFIEGAMCVADLLSAYDFQICFLEDISDDDD